MSRLNRRVAVLVLLLGLVPATLRAQQGATVTGRVTGPEGQPLASASVLVEGTGIGTLTNAQGNYTITIPAARLQGSPTVRVTAQQLGYRSQTQTVSAQAGATVRQDFRLELDPLRLGEIVATGAGLATRGERLGTARATVDQPTIQRANEPNIITALAQKAPNVVTTQASGEPGAGTSIRIRGTSTLSGSGEPTIIVDGMPINNASRSTGNPRTGGILGGVVATNRAFDLNPDDIESIEILKGPAATSILGASAGADGAILIKTRRGAPGSTRYSLRSSAQFDRATRVIPLQRRFGSGTGGIATACLVNLTPGCTHNNPTWGPALAAGTPTYDHASELFETGLLWDNTLTMSGGSERTTFYLSLGALNHNGFIISDNDRYRRYTVRLNGEHQMRDNLRVGGNVSYAQTNGRFVSRGNNVNGLLLGALRTPPEFNNQMYLDSANKLHRSYRFPAPRATDLINPNRGFDNPFFSIYEHPNRGEVGRVYGNLSTNWSPFAWLTVNHTLGADYANDDRTEALHVSAAGAGSGGEVTRWQFYDRILDHNLTATANFRLTPSISGSVSAGQNINEQYFRQIFVNAQRLIAPEPYKLSNTVNRSPPDDSEARRRLEGYFGQAEVDIADQLFVTARLRNDGASTFGESEQRAWYPGGSVAWTFTKALNLPESLLSFGKLRVAYGQSGQEPAVYQLQDIFTNAGIADFNPGSILVPTLAGFGGLYTGVVRGNPDIKPERVAELDAGVDLTVLRGRADLMLTYYDQDSKDVIFSVQTPPSTGAGFVVLNAGEIENKGWEAAVNVRPLQRQDLSLTVGANWARNRNKVLSLGSIGTDAQGNPIPRTVTAYSFSFTGSTTHAEVGQPVGVFRGFGYVRCGMGIAERDAAIKGSCEGAPKGTLYLGADGFPRADPDERIIGDPNPDWTAGFNAEVNLRGVRLSAFVDHRQGGDVLNMTRGSLQSLGVHANTDIRDRPAAPFITLYGNDTRAVGPGANVNVQVGQAFFGNFGGLGTREHLIEDGTFTRLREVSIAYTFRQSWVRQRLGMDAVDVRLSGRNLKLWTDYTGFDPEVHTGGAAVANRGIDWFTNPTSRAIVLSVGLSR